VVSKQTQDLAMQKASPRGKNFSFNFNGAYAIEEQSAGRAGPGQRGVVLRCGGAL
jgi:hypothetical protein